MHQHTFLSPQNSVFHTIIVTSVAGFTLRFHFSEVHNYENSPQLPAHTARTDNSKSNEASVFKSAILLYLWCGLQQHGMCSSPGLHLHTAVAKLETKPYFPPYFRCVSCWSRTLRIPPTINSRKKLFTLCCHQIPMSHFLPIFICLRNVGSSKWFFWCVFNNANLIFLISPNDGETNAEFTPSCSQGKRLFLWYYNNYTYDLPQQPTPEQLELPLHTQLGQSYPQQQFL